MSTGRRDPPTDVRRISTAATWRAQAGAFAVIAVASAILAFFRLSGSARGSLWAEDARIFSQRALEPQLQPFGILTGYAGYTHAVPQLLADLVWAISPIELVAIAVTVAACATAGIIAGTVFTLTASWRIHLVGRLLLALLTVLSPGLPWEILGNLANLHWFFLWLSPFLFLARPRSWVSSIAWAVLCLITVTTEVQSLLFLPLLAWRLKDRLRWPLAGAVVIGATVQLIAFLETSVGRGAGERPLASIVLGYFVQVPLSGLVGSAQAASAAVGFTGWPLAIAALTPFLVAAVCYGWGSRTRTAAAAGLLLASGVLWSAGFWANYFPRFDYASLSADVLIAGVPPLRYAPVPLMFLFAIAALAIGRAQRRGRLAPGAVIAAILCAALLVASYRTVTPSQRDQAPSWRQGVEQAERACAAPGTVAAPVAAGPAHIGWNVDISCALISSR